MIKKEICPDKIHIFGRTPVNEGFIDLVWTGSGVEFDFTGESLGFELEGGSSPYMQWVSLIFDKSPVAHFPVQEGTHEYMLLRGLSPFASHNVRLVKDTQAMPDDPGSFLKLKNIIYNGEIVRPMEKSRRIEFIGDSITSGEGLMGAKGETDWISAYFGIVNNYAYLTADRLDADFRILSQSGWGLCAAYDNNVHNVMPALYDSVYAVRNAFDYDHFSWKADAVIVNLCTNDEGAFSNPAYTDPETGMVYKNRIMPDGTYNKDDLVRIFDGVIIFLKRLRSSNPEAYLLWVFGMCGSGISSVIEKAVDAYKTGSGDDKAGFLLLKSADSKTEGSRFHPGPLCHADASDKISKYLKKYI